MRQAAKRLWYDWTITVWIKLNNPGFAAARPRAALGTAVPVKA
jgi:hypothetical protein